MPICYINRHTCLDKHHLSYTYFSVCSTNNLYDCGIIIVCENLLLEARSSVHRQLFVVGWYCAMETVPAWVLNRHNHGRWWQLTMSLLLLIVAQASEIWSSSWAQSVFLQFLGKNAPSPSPAIQPYQEAVTKAAIKNQLSETGIHWK